MENFNTVFLAVMRTTPSFPQLNLASTSSFYSAPPFNPRFIPPLFWEIFEKSYPSLPYLGEVAKHICLYVRNLSSQQIPGKKSVIRLELTKIYQILQ